MADVDAWEDLSGPAFGRLLRHAAVYAVARVLLSGVDLLLLPVYARVLSQEAYGIIAVATAVMAALTILFPLGLDGALTRFYFDHETTSPHHTRTIGTILVAVSGSILTGGALVVAVGPSPLAPWLGGMTVGFFRLAVGAVVGSLFVQLWLLLLQVQRRPVAYLWVSVGFALVRIVFIVLLVVSDERGADGWVQAHAVASAGGAIVAAVALGRYLRVVPDPGVLTAAIRYGAPLVAHQLAGWASVFAGRLVLNQIMSFAAVGIFQVAFGFGQVLGLVTTAINFAYAPFFLSAATRAPLVAGERFGRFGTYYLAGLVTVAVLGSLFSDWVVALVASEQFLEAGPVVPIVLGGFVLQGAYYVFVNPIFYERAQTHRLPLITVAGGLTSVVTSYALIPSFGVQGAAWGFLLANGVVVAMSYPVSRRALPLAIDLRRVGLIAAAGVLTVITSRCLLGATASTLWWFVANGMLAAVFLAVLAALGMLTPRTLQQVTKLVMGSR